MRSLFWAPILMPALAAPHLLPMLHAQEPSQEETRAPDGGTSYHVTGVELLPIAGHPFSAKSRIDWTRSLQDGTSLQLHLDSNMARDDQGRMYRERRTFAYGQNGASNLKEILLYDPVALTKTTCTVAIRHCVITAYHPQQAFALQPAGAFANGTRYLAREDLGLNIIQGLDVKGTREIITINPGVVGNQQPLVTTKEFWYSPDLQTNVSIVRNDPRQGPQTIQLSDINRSEPEPQFFAPPSGFTVQDLRTMTQTPHEPGASR